MRWKFIATYRICSLTKYILMFKIQSTTKLSEVTLPPAKWLSIIKPLAKTCTGNFFPNQSAEKKRVLYLAWQQLRPSLTLGSGQKLSAPRATDCEVVCMRRNFGASRPVGVFCMDTYTHMQTESHAIEPTGLNYRCAVRAIFSLLYS